jgi:hypothetical protein
LVAASAQKNPANTSAATSAGELTRDQFQALPPDATIEINGKRMTKSAFQESNAKAAQEAAQQLRDQRVRWQAAFEARRKALLDQQAARIADENKKVETELAKLVAADATAHGPNWEERKKQAADLLGRAATASPLERSELEKQADDLLAPSTR